MVTMTALQPFADDTSIGIGGLTLENGPDKLAVYGSLDITRDAPGLAHARALLDVLTRAVAALEAQATLPDKSAKAPAPRSVRNPFG